MKALLGILLLVNAALLLWNMGQREFLHDKHAPAADFHPELMELLPPEKSKSMAKVTIEPADEVATTQTDQTQPLSPPLIAAPDVTAMEASKQTASEIKVLTEVKPGQCMFIGPYPTELDRGRAGRQLQDMKINFSELEDPQGRILGYRVFQGPFATKTEVSRAARRLEKQGVKDLYLMKDAPDRRFISLGFFSNEKSANVFMKNFTALKVKSKQRVEHATQYWLKVSDMEAIEKLSSITPIPLGISNTIKACSEFP
jgi:hypothetical protein